MSAEHQNGQKMKKYLLVYFLIFSVFLYAVLFLVSEYQYSLFHTIAELITVVCSVIIIVILLNVWTFLKQNTFIILIAISIAFVGVVDIVHIFSYTDLNYFKAYDDNLPAQLWIFARYIQAFSVLGAVVLSYYKVKINYVFVILGYIIVTSLGLLLIFYRLFPTSYEVGVGLTLFKIVSEYFIMLIYILVLYLVLKLKILHNENYNRAFILFTVFQIVMGFFFTLFGSLTDYSNFLGHYFKIISVFFFTYVIIKLVLSKPNMVLFEQLKKSKEKLNKIAYTDFLTNLGNRRKFEEELEFIDQKKYLPITYIMIDINGLKIFNDSFGHNVGDELIIEVAKSIIASTDDNAKSYRLGGDEFLIVGFNMDEKAATKIMAKMKKYLRQKRINKSKISISTGIATKKDSSLSIGSLFELSENRMYQNKASEETSRHGDNLKVILNSLFEKNEETEHHSRRVSAIALEFGKLLNLSDAFLSELKLISLLHDIGKIGISEEILNKEGKLTTEEYEIIKTHPVIGNRIISTIRSFEHIGVVILHHHERIDGKGYPNGMKGEDIPYFAKIISICDAFDAMTSERTYRKTKSTIEACQELSSNAGTQFDEALTKLFVEHIDQILQVDDKL